MRLRMIVEWTKGSPLRHAWKEGRLVPVGEDRPAPVNYGLIPGLLNPADGEEVDAVLLGPPYPLGEAEGEVVGLLHLEDGDHKVLLAPQDSPRMRTWPPSSPGSPRKGGPPSFPRRPP
jgi:inorganic pyrophosphatase